MELDYKPDDEMLAAGLGADAILQRTKLPATRGTGCPSGGHCEIVACRMTDGSRRQLFCKLPWARGIRVAEYRVPRKPNSRPIASALAMRRRFTTNCWGPGRTTCRYCTGRCWMMRHKRSAWRWSTSSVRRPCDQMPEPKAGLMAAAGWIGRFHRWSETAAVPSFLHRYDTEFYRVWMQRAGHFTRRLHERCPWLPDLCERCQRRLPALLPPATIIHGDVSGRQHPRV